MPLKLVLHKTKDYTVILFLKDATFFSLTLPYSETLDDSSSIRTNVIVLCQGTASSTTVDNASDRKLPSMN